MPTCKSCQRKWSWWQTLKKTVSFRIEMTCPYCNEKQYFSARYRKKGTIIPFILCPLILFTTAYFSFSYTALIVIALMMLVIFLGVNPLFVELSNEEEPLF